MVAFYQNLSLNRILKSATSWSYQTLFRVTEVILPIVIEKMDFLYKVTSKKKFFIEIKVVRYYYDYI